MKFRKIAAFALAAVMAVSSASLASAAVVGANEDAPSTEKSDESITIALASEPISLLPSMNAQIGNENQIVSGCMLDTLVKQDMNTYELKPSLATEWEWVDDTHCKFTLRDDVVMSDGTPLTADEVVWLVNDVWVAKNATNDTGMFIVGAEANDEHSFTIEFTEKAPDLLGMLSWTNFGIYTADEVEAAGGEEAVVKNPVVGSGRYKFVEWKPAEYITLTRNDDYWDTDYQGYFKDITFKFIGESAARIANVQSGDVDIANDMPVSESSTQTGNDELNVAMYKYGQNGHLWYNMTEGHATSDLKVRQAIDLALNFDGLAQIGTAGAYGPSTGYVEEGLEYHLDTYTPEERAVDVEAAKALLEEAGYGDGLELTTVYMGEIKTVLEAAQYMLQQVGINLTLNSVDTGAFVQAANGGDYDIIFIGEWLPNRLASSFPFIRWDNIHGFHMGGPQTTTDELDGLVHDFIKADDNEAAKEILAQIEQIMKDDCMQSNMYPEVKSIIMNKDLKGFATRERGYLDATSFYK